MHAWIIEDETSILSAEHAAEADQALAGKAGSLTFGQLRSYAHRLVLKLDPEAARKRKEAAKADAHVRRFREVSGNGGMVARELPSDEVLASWQHVEQRALDLRAAGLPGTLQELRVRAYLDLPSKNVTAAPSPLPRTSARPQDPLTTDHPSRKTALPAPATQAAPAAVPAPVQAQVPAAALPAPALALAPATRAALTATDPIPSATRPGPSAPALRARSPRIRARAWRR